MDTTNKDKLKWEREHVVRVLQYHDNKYGTCIAIKGKSEDIYPELKGQLNWGWVCWDTKTNEEIAIEVKRITTSYGEELGNTIRQILSEVKSNLLNKLPGTFLLDINVPQNCIIPSHANRRNLVDTLTVGIQKTALSLNLCDERDLIPTVAPRLSFNLPELFTCILHKTSNEGNQLTLSSGQIFVESINFSDSELIKFEQLVSTANSQLQKAKTKRTFLLLIEEGHRPIDPPAIEHAFTQIDSENYSHIKHVFFVSERQLKLTYRLPDKYEQTHRCY